MRHTFRETLSGLKRNASMTISVIVTMTVSLTLFGLSVMTFQEVERVKGRWYDKIEISVFLCTQDSAGTSQSGNCEPGQATTDDQRDNINSRLESNPEVLQVFYESKEEAYDEYRNTYADSPLLDSLTVEQMQDSFRIKLVDPENYQGVVSEAASLPGVQNVLDLHEVLDPIFSVLNGLKWGTMGLAVLLLVAAMLQIGNTIRMSAFTRRREIGIMRLVGASNVYIMLPFVLEALFAGIISTIISGGALLGSYEFLIQRNAKVSIQALPWITWGDAWFAVGLVAIVAVVLSIVPTLVTTRRYLRV
ncbi:permease-like cell division protein FtsX [Propionimicrobium sp. PCR01-08-3]|uniref:permease-like cell division protein FtsX n=1 Tax=Propionimicrobium sp. PCR01-08-3 TaxID=3052086 RepID=UPI00255C4A0B|nr:permease-like cell division protein FtsX [Propionimicrobium sp. PCR01-08-3]WIY83724.1 permease-like cell division protein FtsX [Propionimicrobium sp. PCR01-08-3]